MDEGKLGYLASRSCSGRQARAVRVLEKNTDNDIAINDTRNDVTADEAVASWLCGDGYDEK